jgi:hypothetical protein
MLVTPQQAYAPTYTVRVSFGAHCFTRDAEYGDTPDFHFKDGGTIRFFCPIRHAYSIHLPDIVRNAAKGNAYFGNGHEKYLLVEKVDGMNAPYVAAFKIEKAKSRGIHASMFVVSAHTRPNLPQNLPTIRLATLVALTVQGKAVARPKK